jgi:hypothetical protein
VSDETVKIEIIYGYASVRPEYVATIMFRPRKWYDKIYEGLGEIWHWVIVPAFWLSFSVACLLFAARMALS